MEVILSRKGFDSCDGGCASPIMPDGTLLSLPIPERSKLKFTDIGYDGMTYDEIWEQLDPRSHWKTTCHLDPDIRPGIRLKPVKGWKPAFGQAGAAETHLENQGVDIGDVFLFFGWFRQTEYTSDGKLRYVAGAPNLHIIYGYMQIGRIVSGKGKRAYSWHPHGQWNGEEDNDTLYIPTKKLTINDQDMGYPGYGVLSYARKRVLTAPGEKKSVWKLPPWFSNVELSYHSKKSFVDGYLHTVGRGQEFVIKDDRHLNKWVMSIIE